MNYTKLNTNSQQWSLSANLRCLAAAYARLQTYSASYLVSRFITPFTKVRQWIVLWAGLSGKNPHTLFLQGLLIFPLQWYLHVLRRSCILKHVTAGKIKGSIEVTGRRGSRRKQLLDDLKEKEDAGNW